MNLKRQKAVISARGHVDATWHSGPRGSATRAHAAYIHLLLLLLCSIYKRSSASRISEGLLILKIFGCYKPDEML